MIAGTKGVFADYPPAVYFDGQLGDEAGPASNAWKDPSTSVWKKEAKCMKLGGHGGMDFIMLYRLLQCMREGLPPEWTCTMPPPGRGPGRSAGNRRKREARRSNFPTSLAGSGRQRSSLANRHADVEASSRFG